MTSLSASSGLSQIHSGSSEETRNTSSRRADTPESQDQKSFKDELSSYSQANNNPPSSGESSSKSKRQSGADAANEGEKARSQTEAAAQVPGQLKSTQSIATWILSDLKTQPTNPIPRDHATSPASENAGRSKQSGTSTGVAKAPESDRKLIDKAVDALPLSLITGQEISLLPNQELKGAKIVKPASSLAATGIDEAASADNLQNDNKTSEATGELALAVQINAGNRQPTGTEALLDSSLISRMPQPGMSLNNEADTRHGDEQQKHQDGNADGAATTEAANTPQSLEAAHSDRAEQPSSARVAELEAQADKFRSEPVRGAHVQIADGNNQQIDIRMYQRGGALSVTFRSNDAAAAKALQEHASDLSSRLAKENYHAQLWKPQTGGQSSANDSHGGGSSQGGTANPNRQNSGHQQQSSRQDQQPNWVEEVEHNPIPYQRRINYTWQQ